MADIQEPQGSPNIEILKFNLDRASTAVEGEYSENDRRLNWFLLFQAFLFQAYATALQSIASAGEKGVFAGRHIYVLLAVLILIGLLTAVITIDATRAGVKAIERLKDKRETVFEQKGAPFGIDPVGFPTTDPLHRRGLRPTRWSPPILLAAWLVVGGHALYTVVGCR